MGDTEPLSGFAKVQSQAQRVRTDAIRMQIEAGLTMCNAIQMEFRAKRAQNMRPKLEKIRHFVSVIQRHIDEPQHVPPESKPELLRLLNRFESRVSELEDRFEHPPRDPSR